MPEKIVKYKILPPMNKKTVRIAQTLIEDNIKFIEKDTGLKLIRTEGLVNGKPMYNSTFIFGHEMVSA